MIPKQDIPFGLASATFVYDAPEGHPSSVTSVKIWDDAQGEDSTEEDAVSSNAIGSVSTTFDSASGASQSDPTLCYLAATTSIVAGRQYLATNAYGEKEWIQVERINSGIGLYSRNALSVDFAVSDTFVDPRITVTLKDAWTALTDNISDPLCPRPRWRAAIVYVVDGVTCYGTAWLDLVRKPFQTTVTPADVDRLARGWLARLSTDDQRWSGQTAIEEAVHQVKLDLWERGVTAYALRNSDVLNELVRLRAVWLVSEQAFREGGVGQLAMEMDRKNYWDRVTNLVTSSQAQIQVTADGAGSTAPRAPLSRR